MKDLLTDIQLQYRQASHGLSQLSISHYYTDAEKLIMFKRIIENYETLINESMLIRDKLNVVKNDH